MDKHFQIWNIKRCFNCCGVISDTIDIKSLIDSKLYYPENENNILKQIGVNKHDKTR
jgi:DNA-directed RNA polymerase subunit N (RpoN/RPB10)